MERAAAVMGVQGIFAVLMYVHTQVGEVAWPNYYFGLLQGIQLLHQEYV